MKTTFKSNFTMLLLTATAVWMNARAIFWNQEFWLGWNAGFLAACVFALWARRLVDWQHDRWLARRGYRRGHVPLDTEKQS